MKKEDNRSIISKLSEQCSNEANINKRIQILYKINSILPKSYQINIPSLITNDYIETALYIIYQKIETESIMRTKGITQDPSF
jgi:hypothetical protein